MILLYYRDIQKTGKTTEQINIQLICLFLIHIFRNFHNQIAITLQEDLYNDNGKTMALVYITH